MSICVLAGCATTTAGQGGAKFEPVAPVSLSLKPEALFAVCWQQDALPDQKMTLTFISNDVIFEGSNGASNSTGRCMREIASSVTWAKRPDKL